MRLAWTVAGLAAWAGLAWGAAPQQRSAWADSTHVSGVAESVAPVPVAGGGASSGGVCAGTTYCGFDAGNAICFTGLGSSWDTQVQAPVFVNVYWLDGKYWPDSPFALGNWCSWVIRAG